MDNKRIMCVNRSDGTTGYKINHEGNEIRRVWAPNQQFPIPEDELMAASLTPGADRILANHLLIDADYPTLCKIFGRDDIVPEYKYVPEEIKRLLTNGTLDELLDCLDFAPDGVIGLLKKFAVEMKLADSNKREAIKQKTGLDLTRMFENMRDDEETAKQIAEAASNDKQRRVPIQTPVEIKVEEILEIN